MPLSKSRKAENFEIKSTRPDKIPGWLTTRPFAHRGLHDERNGIIENSPGAFARAIAEGYGIELDVQLSADNQALVFHDRDLARLAGDKRLLQSITAAEAAEIILTGSKDPIPTLAEMLALINGQVPVLVEIKSRPAETGLLEAAVASVLDACHAPIAIMSFNPDSVAWFADHRPSVTRGLVASTRYPRELGWRLSRSAGQAAAAARVTPDFVACDIRSIPNSFTRKVRDAGLPLLAWTVRSAANHRRAEHHADNVIFENS